MLTTTAVLLGISGTLTVAGLIMSRLTRPLAWLRDTSTEIVIRQSRHGVTSLHLEHDGDVLFGPVAAEHIANVRTAIAAGNPTRDPTKPGGNAARVSYRVVAVADLSNEPGQTKTAIGRQVIILRPDNPTNGRELTIHGGDGRTGSVAGVHINDQDLIKLCGMIGKGEGLRVRVALS